MTQPDPGPALSAAAKRLETHARKLATDRSTLENVKRLVQATLDGTSHEHLKTKVSRDIDHAIGSSNEVQKRAKRLASAIYHYRKRL